jgi:hypothetical protein
MISDWQREMHALGVPSIMGNERPSAEDGGLAWRDVGWGGTSACLIRTDGDGKTQAVRAYDLWRLLTGVVVAAAREAGVPVHLFGDAGHAAPGLVEDPAEWFRRN